MKTYSTEVPLDPLPSTFSFALAVKQIQVLPFLLAITVVGLMSVMGVVVPALEPLRLSIVFDAEHSAACAQQQALVRGSQHESWLTFRESDEAAWERSSWHTEATERLIIHVLFTTKGVGHYSRMGLLTNLPQHGTWRFHSDLPFEVRDSDGDLLVTVDQTVARAIQMSP